MIIPNRIITKAEAIRGNLAEPWARNQVDRCLADLLYWMKNGYQFTEEQRARFTRLAEFLEEKEEKE